jgi:hypothetical protein
MRDVLSRYDLPSASKWKLYQDALNRFAAAKEGGPAETTYSPPELQMPERSRRKANDLLQYISSTQLPIMWNDKGELLLSKDGKPLIGSQIRDLVYNLVTDMPAKRKVYGMDTFLNQLQSNNVPLYLIANRHYRNELEGKLMARQAKAVVRPRIFKAALPIDRTTRLAAKRQRRQHGEDDEVKLARWRTLEDIDEEP